MKLFQYQFIDISAIELNVKWVVIYKYLIYNVSAMGIEYN